MTRAGFRFRGHCVFLCLAFLLPGELLAVSVEIVAVDNFLKAPPALSQIFPYVINLVSHKSPLEQSAIKPFDKLADDLIYYSRVKVDGATYYRLSLGNFDTRRQAQIALDRVKPYFPGAWIGKRTDEEKKLLSAAIEVVGSVPVVAKVKQSVPGEISEPLKTRSNISAVDTLANKLSEQIRAEFLDKNYQQVIRISDKLIELGDLEQRQQAMELAGLARERQGKFAQAIAIYQEFLALYPESELKPRVKQRLQGLQTMNLDPKQPIASREASQEDFTSWDMRGGISQYYRKDLLDRDEFKNEPVNEVFVTDVDIYAQRKTATTSTVIQFDGGIINDQIDDENYNSISRALVSYSDTALGFQVTGGRQTRTAKGVYGRFDGFVYQGLSQADFDYSLHTGYLVESSLEASDSNRPFYGGSIHFSPYEAVEMDVYVLHQEVFGLTDRQAVGTEFQILADQGFLYGIVDYDIFFGDLNNVTAISNYRYNDQWTFNLTYDYRNSPLLTTTNAIQGQGVESIDELQMLFTNREIYQLAEDRTSKSQNVFAGASYQIDMDHQLYLSLSLSTIESTKASAGVPEIPASDDIYLSGEYSIRGFFYTDDYSSFGLGVSDTSSAETISLRARSRFPGPGGFRYDPRIRIDFRESQNSNIEQWILAPSITLTYQYGRNTSFEGSFGIEYSNFDLPELDDQRVYDIFLGYVYQF